MSANEELGVFPFDAFATEFVDWLEGIAGGKLVAEYVVEIVFVDKFVLLDNAVPAVVTVNVFPTEAFKTGPDEEETVEINVHDDPLLTELVAECGTRVFDELDLASGARVSTMALVEVAPDNLVS